MKRIIIIGLLAAVLFVGCASTYVTERETRVRCERYNRCVQDCENEYLDSMGEDFTRAICADQCQDSTCTERVVHKRDEDPVKIMVVAALITLVLSTLF